MTIKFGRNYRLTIETGEETEIDQSDQIEVEDLMTGEQSLKGFSKVKTTISAIIVTMPTTAQFTIERGSSASYNQMQIVLYNLSEDDRSKIFMDRFIYDKPKRILLEAGYGDDLAIVFAGTIRQASSARQGSNIVTIINAQDSGYDLTTTQTNRTVAAGTSFLDLIKGLIGDFPNINQGSVTAPDGTTKRPTVLNGNTLELLRIHTDDRFFVDQGIGHVLDHNEAFEGEIHLFDAEAGLLETPRRDDANLSIVTIFEPRMTVGQYLEFKSAVQKQYNGQYKVLGIRHECTMSGAVGGNCQSTFTLYAPNLVNTLLKVVPRPDGSELPSYAGDTPNGNFNDDGTVG